MWRQILKLQQLTGAQQKYPWGVLAQAEFGATGLELFSPHDSDSIYRKAYPQAPPLRSCCAKLVHYGRQRYPNLWTCTGDTIDPASSTRNRTSLLPRFLCHLTSIPFLNIQSTLILTTTEQVLKFQRAINNI
ncbi:hypothetical protein Zmor_017657 [Zophobas morio]|uniref:Uncharacterized protein n=1 Tax=Zophobas morio TaxID=2755281 RepID=A0AA38I9Y9_9CUCU|nr:hypothetical protein Zmor_017657 [Zophobas morio]